MEATQAITWKKIEGKHIFQSKSWVLNTKLTFFTGQVQKYQKAQHIQRFCRKVSFLAFDIYISDLHT